jgi:hypothetical protein
MILLKQQCIEIYARMKTDMMKNDLQRHYLRGNLISIEVTDSTVIPEGVF